MPSPRTSTIRGFTIVELLVAMGIFTLLASLGLFISMDFYRSYSFRSDTASLVSAIMRARSRSLDNINGSPHGIFIASSSYTIFQGTSYAARDGSYDETFALGGDTRTSGLTEAVFARLDGQTTDGTLIVTDEIHTATISLNHEGRIDW